MELKKVIILGTTQFSVMMCSILESEGYSVYAYSTYKEYLNSNFFMGYPVFPTEDLAELMGGVENFMILNTIRYSKLNTIRERTFADLKMREYDIMTFISQKANIYTDKIGQGCIVMPGCFIGNNIVLGESNVIYTNTVLTHDISIGAYNFIGANVVIGGNVTMDTNNFVGMNSVIKNRVRVGSYSIIGCGSNVIASIKSYSVYTGNPAVHKKNILDINSVNI